jgi:hypothetical protein
MLKKLSCYIVITWLFGTVGASIYSNTKKREKKMKTATTNTTTTTNTTVTTTAWPASTAKDAKTKIEIIVSGLEETSQIMAKEYLGCNVIESDEKKRDFVKFVRFIGEIKDVLESYKFDQE